MVRRGIEVVLAGSVRDDGPLPEVITDSSRASGDAGRAARGRLLPDDRHRAALVATGNLLPAWVKVVCVDINPATVTKLSDRGTFQARGLVTDVEPFSHTSLGELGTVVRRRQVIPCPARR